MEKHKKSLADFAKLIQENSDGTLAGGFTIINAVQNNLIIGGEEANNCDGGNCVAGCAQNNVAGCGGTVNSVPGCGVKTF